MKRFSFLIVLVSVLSTFFAALVFASAIDTHIKNLKTSKDPEVRAKAAYELGCG
jgi:hypothetical protein